VIELAILKSISEKHATTALISLLQEQMSLGFGPMTRALLGKKKTKHETNIVENNFIQQ